MNKYDKLIKCKNVIKLFLIFFVLLSFLFCSKNIFASSDILGKTNKSINIYEKFDIKSIQNDITKTYTYSSSDSSIASVDKNGIVTGNKLGSVNITLTDTDSNSQTCNISVGYYKGIDISTFNGNVDFASLKKQGIDFVMIRASYGWYDDNDRQAGKSYGFQYDEQLLNNLKGASENQIPFGIYHYAYARNVNEANLEADYVLSALRQYGSTYSSKMTLPIAYDVEDKYISSLSPEDLTNVIVTFCKRIREAGYTPMVYANKTWLLNHMNITTLNNLGYDFWYALWPNTSINFSDKIQIGSTGIFPLIWQYTSSGSVPGANTSSGTVDLDVMYMKEQVKITFISDGNIVEERGINKGAYTSFPKVSKDGNSSNFWIDENSNIVKSNTTIFNSNTNLTALYKITLNKNEYIFDDYTPLNLNVAETKDVTWTSSDKNVAVVSKTGEVTVVGKGTCTITATINDESKITDICKVTSNVNTRKGDMNKDGIINVLDVIYGLKKVVVGTLTIEDNEIGDVNGNGMFDITDAIKIMNYIVGKIKDL